MKSVLLATVLALCLASCVLAATADEVNFGKFNEFVRRFDRKYKSMDEFLFRYSNFLNNLARAEEMNRNDGGNRFGITKFSDLSSEEFKKLYTGFRPSADRLSLVAQAHVQKPRTRAVPSSYDWRTSGAITAVKDQGQCGSCWAFSTVEEIESMHFLKNHTLPILSEQELVDCDTKTDAGCDGGDTVTAYDYLAKNGGLESEKDYPYKGKDGTCKFSKNKSIAKISGFTYATKPCYDSCKKQDENTLQANLYSTGPVSICVDATIWQIYTGGVIEAADKCSYDYYDLNHCVQLVGYNTDKKGTYWLVRNSWASDWGEKGYIYLRMGSNVCGVADEATFATIA